ncbi:MAG: hypothetical protein E7Z65_02810 [Thermoplasmata archaeon]|nr:hypothetical protein [Thermoplasmata archaeon]
MCEMNLGKENATTAFFESMDDITEAIKAMTAMLNRYNRAELFIGINHKGFPCGNDMTDEDIFRIDRTITC